MGAPRHEDRVIGSHPMCEDGSCPSKANCYRHPASGRIAKPKAQPYFSEPTRAKDEASCPFYWPIKVPGVKRPSLRRLTVDHDYTYRNDPSQIAMFLNSGDVAKMLGVTKNTVAKMVKRVDFPKPISLSGKIKLWSVADIETWLESNRTRSGEGVGWHAWRKPREEGPAYPWIHEEPHDK